MALTPALTIVPGAWGGKMVTAGLWLGNRLNVTTPGGAGGTGCSEATAELLTGPGREVAATDFQQGHQMKGEQ